MDFYEIRLNRKEFDALCALNNANDEHCAIAVDEKNRTAFYHLQELGLANISFSGGEISNKTATLTFTGKNYLRYAKERRHDKRFENTRYWITTSIALAALVVSVVALLYP